MRTLTAAVLVALVGGCASSAPPPAETRVEEANPLPVNRVGVRVEGIDGTVMTGEMLNGSVTIDSGMGALTLQSGNVHTITFASDGDRVEADNVNVSGKIRETQFNLKTKHGVFPLTKERLRRITFINNKPDEGDLLVRTSPVPAITGNPPVAAPTTPAPAAGASSTSTSPSTRTVPPPTATRYQR